MKAKKILSIITAFCMIMSVLSCINVYAYNTNSSTVGDVYVDFSEISSDNGISVLNDQGENVTIDGIKGKKISSGDGIYLDVDDDFNPTKWAIIITYYDEGTSEGDIVVSYSSESTAKQLKIRKTAMSAKWVTASLFVDDGVFGNKLTYNSDIIITADSGIFSKIELVDLSDENVAVYGNITPASVNDSKSGRTWQYMNFNGKPAIRPYVTAQGWNNEGTKFLFKSYMWVEASDNINTSFWAMYEYDTVNSRVVMLDTYVETVTTGLYAIVTPNDIIYYAKSDDMTWKMDWLTYKKQCTKAKSYGTMNVTNDGVWVTGYGGDKNYIYRSNTITGETDSINIDSAYAKWVGNSNSSGKGHPMINPEHPDLFFFCHEGTTQYIPDRLWYANFDTKDVYNMFVQVPYSSTITAETSGHEIWSDDGEMLYWIKYTYVNNIGQSGMMRMDKYGSNREYINHDFNFWHCFPSSDHNFVVGDTNTSTSEVAIVSTNSYKSWRIASFSVGWNHPNQPHPHISRNNYNVSWQVVNNGVTSIGWNEVRDITLNPKEKEIIPFGNDTEIITCEGAASESDSEVVDGVCYRVAQSGKGIYVNILNEVCKSTAIDVTLDVTYLDKGTNPINIVYTAGVTGIGDLANRENKTKTISKTNSGEQKTQTVSLGNINANDIGKFMSDLYFTTEGEATYISDIDVRVSMGGQKIVTTKSISSTANSEGDAESGLCCTATHNMPTYNNNLYHVDDVEGWTEAGISQSSVTAAKNAGNSYITYQYDGAWIYDSFTDASGVTKQAFYAPKNYRDVAKLSSGHQIGGNIYFRLTDDIITETDNELTFTVEYLDRGNISITYLKNGGFGYAKISGGNTNKWKKSSVTVYDAKLSSTNSETKLASGVDDIKVSSDGNGMYISSFEVSKKTEEYVESDNLSLKEIYYQGEGFKAPTLTPLRDMTPVAVVKNDGNTDRDVFVATIIYKSDNKTADSIILSQPENIPKGETKEVFSPAVNIGSSVKYKTFVWQDNLKPVVKKQDLINLNISGSDSGIMVSFSELDGYTDEFYNVFCDGNLVMRTQKVKTVVIDGIYETGHMYFVEVTDKFGKSLYRTDIIQY